MEVNPLTNLQNYGQSIWLDYIERNMILSGEMKRLIDEYGIRGVTSNPSIFNKSISRGEAYNAAIEALVSEGKDAFEIYNALVCEDIITAADLFREIYDKSEGGFGYVSLEVNPHFAYDTQGTIMEARRLWTFLNRPNVMIKVPGTKEGLIAVRELISEGININVTLLFGLPQYGEVQKAYLSGLEGRLKQDRSIGYIRSVASFFLSRIDLAIDSLLDDLVKKGSIKAEKAESLKGKTAIASAKSAYLMYTEAFNNKRFKELADNGAKTQQLLWASTSTKNPTDSDVKYIEALIGPETINTLPLETLIAYRDQGNPKARLEEDMDMWRNVLKELKETGIDIDEVTQKLEEEGIIKFSEPYDNLIRNFSEKLKLN